MADNQRSLPSNNRRSNVRADHQLPKISDSSRQRNTSSRPHDRSKNTSSSSSKQLAVSHQVNKICFNDQEEISKLPGARLDVAPNNSNGVFMNSAAAVANSANAFSLCDASGSCDEVEPEYVVDVDETLNDLLPQNEMRCYSDDVNSAVDVCFNESDQFDFALPQIDEDLDVKAINLEQLVECSNENVQADSVLSPESKSISTSVVNVNQRIDHLCNDNREGDVVSCSTTNSTNQQQLIGMNANSRNQPIVPVLAQNNVYNAAAVARGAAGLCRPISNRSQHNWQSTKQTLKERFSFMFCNEILADVHFVVGRSEQRQRIPAHKFVLSVGSAVFDAMFNGAMSHNPQEDVDLPDVEPAAFLALLKFLYSDEVQIGPESVMTTLYTAKKYAVPALENSCVEFLKRNLSADNSFMLLTQARLFDEPQLAALCLETIDKHTVEALNADGFTDIDLATLCAVLERDTLRIREAQLFHAVVKWSCEECRRQQLSITSDSQRLVLAHALTLMRFPLMSVEEFAQHAAQSGILLDREVVNLFLYFTVNPKPSVAFLDVPRCCVTGKEQVVNRFQRIDGRWGYSGTPDRIKFTVDRRIFVVGFGLYGSIHGPTEYQANVQIIHCGTGKVIGSNDTAFQCDGSQTAFRVLFKEPVEISPCVTYIASGTLKGPDSFYGTKGLRRIVHQSSNAGCVTFQFTYAAGNNNGTSVEDGQIPEIIFYTKLSQ